MSVFEIQMAHFLAVGLLSGLFAFWLTGWVYRDNRKLRWFWFLIVRTILIVIAYLPPK